MMTDKQVRVDIDLLNKIKQLYNNQLEKQGIFIQLTEKQAIENSLSIIIGKKVTAVICNKKIKFKYD